MIPQIVDVSGPVAVIGGAKVDREVLKILQTLTDSFVAADGGANVLQGAGVQPIRVFGDLDSISDEARQEFAPHLVHIAEQDTTDLEKVVARVRAPVLVGAGFLGGRLDHTFAALNVLVRHPQVPLVLVDVVDCCFACPSEGLSLALPIGTPIAILPMGEAVVTTRGLAWDMDQAALRPAGMVSSSNRTAAAEVSIAVDGPAIITLPFAHLPDAIAAVRAG